MRSLIGILCFIFMIFPGLIELSTPFDFFSKDSPVSDDSHDNLPSTSHKRNRPSGVPLPLYEPHLRKRSRSPATRDSTPFGAATTSIRLPSPNGYGCGIEQLTFIRLSPLINPHRVFECRTYTFPADKSIEIRIGPNRFVPVPTEEQIVFSTPRGDVYGVIKSWNALSGIYSNNVYKGKRAKINMGSEKVTLLTEKEINETPVGDRRPIMMNYRVENVVELKL